MVFLTELVHQFRPLLEQRRFKDMYDATSHTEIELRTEDLIEVERMITRMYKGNKERVHIANFAVIKGYRTYYKKDKRRLEHLTDSIIAALNSNYLPNAARVSLIHYV